MANASSGNNISNKNNNYNKQQQKQEPNASRLGAAWRLAKN